MARRLAEQQAAAAAGDVTPPDGAQPWAQVQQAPPPERERWHTCATPSEEASFEEPAAPAAGPLAAPAPGPRPTGRQPRLAAAAAGGTRADRHRVRGCPCWSASATGSETARDKPASAPAAPGPLLKTRTPSRPLPPPPTLPRQDVSPGQAYLRDRAAQVAQNLEARRLYEARLRAAYLAPPRRAPSPPSPAARRAGAVVAARRAPMAAPAPVARRAASAPRQARAAAPRAPPLTLALARRARSGSPPRRRARTTAAPAAAAAAAPAAAGSAGSAQEDEGERGDRLAVLQRQAAVLYERISALSAVVSRLPGLDAGVAAAAAAAAFAGAPGARGRGAPVAAAAEEGAGSGAADGAAEGDGAGAAAADELPVKGAPTGDRAAKDTLGGWLLSQQGDKRPLPPLPAATAAAAAAFAAERPGQERPSAVEAFRVLSAGVVKAGGHSTSGGAGVSLDAAAASKPSGGAGGEWGAPDAGVGEDSEAFLIGTRATRSSTGDGGPPPAVGGAGAGAAAAAPAGGKAPAPRRRALPSGGGGGSSGGGSSDGERGAGSGGDGGAESDSSGESRVAARARLLFDGPGSASASDAGSGAGKGAAAGSARASRGGSEHDLDSDHDLDRPLTCEEIVAQFEAALVDPAAALDLARALGRSPSPGPGSAAAGAAPGEEVGVRGFVGAWPPPAKGEAGRGGGRA
jgi:hypothetical protein